MKVVIGEATPQSFLFVPADQESLVEKATRCRPDAVILDLEDGVSPPQKEAARATARRSSLRLTNAGIMTFVRVNDPTTAWFDDDVASALPDVGIVLPKCATPADVDSVRRATNGARSNERPIVAGIETAVGLANVHAIASAGVLGLYFGAEDFIADMRGRRTASGAEVIYARSVVVHAARAAGVLPIDQAVLAIRDDEAFRSDCMAGLDLGYGAKLCLHPSQVIVAHECFSPNPSEVREAQLICNAFDEARGSASGTVVVGGRMVDAPVVAQAQQVVERHRRRNGPTHGVH